MRKMNFSTDKICILNLSTFPEIQYHVEDLSLSIPEKVQTKLEFLFKNKEYCEECMQEIDKKKPIENPPEEHASQEPHAKTFAHPLVPYVSYDVSFK
jgi:hypothetical protein